MEASISRTSGRTLLPEQRIEPSSAPFSLSSRGGRFSRAFRRRFEKSLAVLGSWRVRCDHRFGQAIGEERLAAISRKIFERAARRAT